MNETRSFRDEFPRDLEGVPIEPTLSLARRSDFQLGAANIRPSVRTIEGPGGTSTVEPRVMQVLLALADAQGAVLSRDDLIRICWNGQIVGDDSINRAIAEVRRLVRATGAGFNVQTIPRIGYRLEAAGTAKDAEPIPSSPARTTRRWLLGGGLAFGLGIGGLAAWSTIGERRDPRAAELIERGRQALRDELPDSNDQGVGFLRNAVAIEPEDAEAWGLLALALRNVVEHSPPRRTAAAVRDCELAANRALALDAREGNALTALATIRPAFGDWIAADDRLRSVLAIAPDNIAALGHFSVLMQSTGREREAWRWNERAANLDPLSPVPQMRRAWKLWMFGRTPEADLTIDRALQLWPRHPGVWYIRLVIFALTGRPRAALAMLKDEEARPPRMSAPAIAKWRASFIALETRSPADIAAARRANTETATRGSGFAVNAVMILCALGEIDAAFEVANGYLLRRGSLIGGTRSKGGEVPVNDQRWRKTMMLFIPPAAPMQADPRFLPLCAGIGLVDYWHRRGVRPDFMRRS